MEWKSNLRRTRSLQSVSLSCDKPIWTEGGLRHRKTSVSQLIARYQTTVKIQRHIQPTAMNYEVKPKKELKQMNQSPPHVNDLLESNNHRKEFWMKGNDQTQSGLIQSSTSSISALKAKFESKDVTQTELKESFTASSFRSFPKRGGITMNGEDEAEEERKSQYPSDDEGIHARKVLDQTRADRRRTTVAIDFETHAASQTDEKRRSIADFRDSSIKDKVSVKAMSALYLSKVSAQEPNRTQAPELGKKTKQTKMAEDSQQSKDSKEDAGGAHSQQFIQSQPSKEILHQQRQKCELRRLLKHTHPELKMLDEAVDEELAEVLTSETGVTAADTGYEGEVLTRRLIFENCAMSKKVSPHATNMRMVEGKAEIGNGHKISPVVWSVKGVAEADKTPEPEKECEEEIRIDVRSTRRIFEGQLVNTSQLQGNYSICGNEAGTVQKKKHLETCSNEKGHNKTSGDSVDGAGTQEPGDHTVAWNEVSTEEFGSTPEADCFGEVIKTSVALLQHNPFIAANIEKEHLYPQTTKSNIPAGGSAVNEDYLTANVKNRAHLFESMPFDKIRQQNKDEIETMVENIRETLNLLYRANVVYSRGSIIEVNETMIAKKAKFTLTNEGPEIIYNELAEGGAQNLILQLLPRANIKPEITYLKEGSKGEMVRTVLHPPISHDTEFKTASVVQLIEDVLTQDNSLRKGVIIQEEVNRCAEVMVYSIYNYFDEEDIKSYCPPPQQMASDYNEQEIKASDMSLRQNQGVRHSIIKTAINCLLETSQDHTCSAPVRPDITVRGNVKLFKTCIEKGDLEYLKTLQAEPTVQDELPSTHEERSEDAEETTTEYVPVDVKRLKNLFSADQRQIQPKQSTCKNQTQSPAKISTSTGQSVSSLESNIAHEHVPNTSIRNNLQTQQDICDLPIQSQDGDRILQAEFVDAVDDCDEIVNLQTAIHNLQQATIEAQTIYHSLEEKLHSGQHPSEKSSVAKCNAHVCFPEGAIHKDGCHQHPPTCNIATEHESVCKRVTMEACHQEVQFEDAQTADSWPKKDREMLREPDFQPDTASSDNPQTNPAQEEDEEVDLHGKLQAALDSLERSNINVTRGDFKAAMIYRRQKPPRVKSQNVDASSKNTANEIGFCPVPELKSTQGPQEQEVVTEEVMVPKREPPCQSSILNNPASEKSKRSLGPKPAIPPKPAHLKSENQNTKESPEAIKTHTTSPKTEETDPQVTKSFHGSHEPDVSKTTNEPRNDQADIQVKASAITLKSANVDTNINYQEEQIYAREKEKMPESAPVKESFNETDESHVDFHEARKKFGGMKAVSKNPPVKPKRVKMVLSDSKGPRDGNSPATEQQDASCGHISDNKKEREQGVEMREKKVRHETEDERRQRLSVHMDEIMRGNITAAMEIFDKLLKQQELQSILSRVEEIEQDTSEVDVQSLRKVFENVPDWVVNADKKEEKNIKVQLREKPKVLKENTERNSSMANVFGDLERASEEIMNLKEQTLARLVDIEEAIKKALYSVSTLKSESDIAGLSCLFKESLGTVQGSSSGNISKISIESSRKKTARGSTSSTTDQGTNGDVAATKQRGSPLSSPAFISIESAARKMDKTDKMPSEATVCPTCQYSPKDEEKFRTTKTLKCNSPAPNRKLDPITGGQKQTPCSPLNPKRELSVLEVQTDHEGNRIVGTKTVRENYERTDNFGNRFYSTKTSTVVTTQPQTSTSTTAHTVTSPASYQFQPACQEMCSACLKPVFPMEKIATDKYIFHKTCFCCKQCKKKLSMYNYAPLYGELYCIFHYQQLFRKKGNYDEGFGHTQHKNRWLMARSSMNESEA